MKDAILVVLIVFTAALSFIFGAIWEQRQNFKKGRQPTCQSELKDPCQEIHGLNTKGMRDYKPKYDRNLKQVVLTCEVE
jgi:hypothetical protein